jgi:hypothetical protein
VQSIVNDIKRIRKHLEEIKELWKLRDELKNKNHE